ncbi:Hypothetical predicted protein [Olea europaea subsp. europaea]|uniref:Transposase (putative) gypsy type domain-containing protein n=1 Tax=Olea europaea subsp. europaea TaxID=158383 RepID=A0A8S0QET8_OLEEU|nr:Hypothetical predicted protein [Olea europaea subsp. europaea]
MDPKKSRDSDSGSSALGGYPNDILSSDDDGIPIRFSRGSYQPPTLTAPNGPSVYTEATLKEVVHRFNLGQNFLYRVPKSSDIPSKCFLGEITVFKGDLDGGLRFPFHPFLKSLLVKHNLTPGQIVPNGWRMLVYFLLVCMKNDISPSVKVGELSFPNKWGYPDVSKFNRSVTCAASLKQELDKLIRLEPLGEKMSQVSTGDMLMSVGLGHHDCAEGMDFDAWYVFKMTRQKFTAPGASSPSGRKRAAISSPDVPSPQNPSTSPQPSVVGCVDIELKKSLEQKSLEESRQGLLMEISRVATFGVSLYERAKDAEKRTRKAEEEFLEKGVQVERLMVERAKTSVEIQNKDYELHDRKKALTELEQKVASHDVSLSDAVSIYKKTNELKETLAMYGSKSYLLALEHVKAWLRQSHPTIDPAELEVFLSTLDVGSRSPGGDEM